MEEEELITELACVSIKRPCLTEKSLKQKFSMDAKKERPSNDIKGRTRKYFANKFKPNKECACNFFSKHLPFLKMISTYDYRKSLFRDSLAGLTVGVIQIAPTMANALVANLPPINGLYVAFFSVLMYTIFGTSYHLSMGTHGVISLMVGKIIDKYDGILYSSLHSFNASANHNSTQFLSDDPVRAKVMIATSLTCLIGLIQFGFWIVKGGIIAKYLSDTVTESFTIGSSYIIVVSQINDLLGFPIKKKEHLPFELINNLIAIITNIKATNLATALTSLICMILLYCVKKFVNERFKKKLPAPIPIELIVVILATLFSHYFHLGAKFGVSVVGHIPQGIPAPQIPIFGIFYMLIEDAFTLSIVSFAINISLGKFFAKRHHYSIDPNQEFFAYSTGNIVTSLFGGFAGCGGLTRSLIVENVGSKTQIYSIVSSLFVLVVILGTGFLFKDLPNCVLSAIIVISLIHNCMKILEVKKVFNKNKVEFIAWISTFGGVVIFDIDIGLYIGLAIAIFLVVYQTQWPKASVLGNIPNTELYEDISICQQAIEHEEIKIIRYESPLYYANAENFVNTVVKLSGVDPNSVIVEINKIKFNFEKKIKKSKEKKNECLKMKKLKINSSNDEENPVDKNAEEMKLSGEIDAETRNLLDNLRVKHIILDCRCVTLVDSMGVDALVQLSNVYQKCNVKIHLTYLNRSVLETLRRYASFEQRFSESLIYPTTIDAVNILRANKTHSF